MKRPGYCTLCEKQVFDFSPVLKPLEIAWRVSFLMTDDTSADITFCDECLNILPENLEKIWEICLERFDYEEKQRGTPSPEADAMISHLKDQHLVHEQTRIRWDSLA